MADTTSGASSSSAATVIGLHDEHAPVAPVIGRNIRLRRHDVVEARHVIEHVGDDERLAADVGPAIGEAVGVMRRS
jgi:hypothetical protein